MYSYSTDVCGKLVTLVDDVSFSPRVVGAAKDDNLLHVAAAVYADCVILQNETYLYMYCQRWRHL